EVAAAVPHLRNEEVVVAEGGGGERGAHAAAAGDRARHVYDVGVRLADGLAEAGLDVRVQVRVVAADEDVQGQLRRDLAGGVAPHPVRDGEDTALDGQERGLVRLEEVE